MECRGVIVEVANHGQQALDKIAAQPNDYYDLVLMDLQMPVMGGYEATRRLRDYRHYDALPIVARRRTRWRKSANAARRWVRR